MWIYCVYWLALVIDFTASKSVSELINDDKLDNSLQISTSSGIVQGRKAITKNNVPYWTYQGIPYAKPPLGPLRFRAPLPAKPWKGVLDATREKQCCVETLVTTDGVHIWGQEDCLHVNIYTQRNPVESKQRLPVLVWIYGGAFSNGNSSTKLYGPDKLIEQDIVLVMFNYRIGIFGFLSTEDFASPGNYGLKDQNLVLRWVHKNIKNFGGDKNRVTIFGQSAGAASVLYHVASPQSKGLFHRAIASSGSPLCIWAYKQNPRDLAFDAGIAAGLKTKNTTELVAQLRKADSQTLEKVSRLTTLISIIRAERGISPFVPTIEPPHKEAFLTENVLELFQTGRFNRVPILMGMNTLETTLFWEAIRFLRPFITVYDLSPGSIPNSAMNIRTFEERREVGLKLKNHYLGRSTFLDATVSDLLYLTSDDQFIRPMTKTIRLMYKYTPVYQFVFSYASNFGEKSLAGYIKKKPINNVTAHAEEQWYIWESKILPHPPIPNQQDQLVSRRLLTLIKNFVTTGNPTPVKDNVLQNILWPPIVSSNNLTYLNIDSNLRLDQNFRKKHMDFWESLYNQYGHNPYLTY